MLKNAVREANNPDRIRTSEKSPLTLIVDNRRTFAEPATPEDLEFVQQFDRDKVEFRYANAVVEVTEHSCSTGARQTISMSLREPSHDRDYGWIEIKDANPTFAANTMGFLHDIQGEVISPAELDKLLRQVGDDYPVVSNLGNNRAAIVHRYEDQLRRTTDDRHFERGERIPAIKILEIRTDGSGQRFNWKNGDVYPSKPVSQWTAHDEETAETPPALADSKSREKIEPKVTYWIDVEQPTEEKMKLIAEKFKIPQSLLHLNEQDVTVVKDRKHTSLSIRILEIGDDRSDSHNDGRPHFGAPETVRIVVYKDCVVTLRSAAIPAMSDTRRKFELSEVPLTSHDGAGAVVTEILEECAKENLSKLDFLEKKMEKYGAAVERRLFALPELSALHALRKSFKQGLSIFKREEGISKALEIRGDLFRSVEPGTICQEYRVKLEMAREKASDLLDSVNDHISTNGNRLGARAATVALAALSISISQGAVQALADGSFEPSRWLAGAILGFGVLGAAAAGVRSMRRGQW